MVSQDRWQDAQSYEQGYWDQVAQEARAGNREKIDFYRWRAEQLVARLNELGRQDLTDGSARVVEIGCGPIGVAGFFPASEAVCVDPLEDFYASRPALVELRNQAVSYRAGTGEELPAPDDHFDLVVIENCIDHCQDMDAVMADIRRVLKPSGTLYLTVNARSRPGYFMHRILSKSKVDAGHPHTFTFRRAQRFIERHGFRIEGLDKGSWLKAWKEDLAADGLKPKAKGILFVSEFLVSVVARMEG